MWFLLVLSLRASGSEPTVSEPTVSGPIVYAQASSLNLRATPELTGRLLGKLAVNSPLRVLEEQLEWEQVETANGKRGWSAEHLWGQSVSRRKKRRLMPVRPSIQLSGSLGGSGRLRSNQTRRLSWRGWRSRIPAQVTSKPPKRCEKTSKKP